MYNASVALYLIIMSVLLFVYGVRVYRSTQKLLGSHESKVGSALELVMKARETHLPLALPLDLSIILSFSLFYHSLSFYPILPACCFAFVCLTPTLHQITQRMLIANVFIPLLVIVDVIFVLVTEKPTNFLIFHTLVCTNHH